MKILFAPSETKKAGGIHPFNPQSLLFETLLPHRMKLLHSYTNIIQQGDLKVLAKMFGIKKESDIRKYQKDIIHEGTMKAIERYTGVAFDYLAYSHLDTISQTYIDEHVILFSNLFGPIRASDLIPEYKLKQGATVGDIKTEKLYHAYASSQMQTLLNEKEILDLRAGFYTKFYKPTSPYTTLKFIKNGKVVSHWAKAYRGIVLREIALNTIQSIDEFLNMPINNLSIEEIIHTGIHTEIIYTILDT